MSVEHRSICRPIYRSRGAQNTHGPRIPQNTRTNISLAIRVWFEWAEEGNDLIQIIAGSETNPQVDPEILNHWLSKFVVEVRKTKGPRKCLSCNT